MRVLTAKEFFVGHIPLAGEYALYQDKNEYYFVIGDGIHAVEDRALPSFSIPENVFNSMKSLGDKYPVKGCPYKQEDLDGYDMHIIGVIHDFMYEAINEEIRNE